MEELEQQVAEIVGTFRLEALHEYKYALQEAGLKMTGDLLNSLESVVRHDAALFVWECQVSFADYGRWVDMKGLNTGKRMAPVEALMYWVEKTGPEKFLNKIWAKRYGNLTGEKLIRNIAWGVRIARFREIRHVRRHNGWYNKSTKWSWGITQERLRQAAALCAIRTVKNILTSS